MAQLPLIIIGRIKLFRDYPALGNVSFHLCVFRTIIADSQKFSLIAAVLLAGPSERIPSPRCRVSFLFAPFRLPSFSF